MRVDRPRRDEQGFVLIAAIWLLILAGSIAAILMLRSMAGATAAAEHQDSAQRMMARDSAIETMLADRLFNGERSVWWTVPAAGTIAIGDRRVTLSVTSESGRLDVNGADPALIDRALQGFGVGAADRTRIVARLTALRTAKRRIASLPELLALIGGARARSGSCIADSLTWISGMAEPRPDQMPSDLARALGGAGGAAAQASRLPPEGGAALRVEASEAGRPPMIAIVRTSGLPQQPTSISVWGAPAPCPATVTQRS